MVHQVERENNKIILPLCLLMVPLLQSLCLEAHETQVTGVTGLLGPSYKKKLRRVGLLTTKRYNTPLHNRQLSIYCEPEAQSMFRLQCVRKGEIIKTLKNYVIKRIKVQEKQQQQHIIYGILLPRSSMAELDIYMHGPYDAL